MKIERGLFLFSVMTVFQLGNNQSTTWQRPLRCITGRWIDAGPWEACSHRATLPAALGGPLDLLWEVRWQEDSREASPWQAAGPHSVVS